MAKEPQPKETTGPKPETSDAELAEDVAVEPEPAGLREGSPPAEGEKTPTDRVW